MIDGRVHTPRLLWVKNGSGGASKLCLRYPTKQTSTPATATSVSCQEETHAPQQNGATSTSLSIKESGYR
jgi:hypothetical protein